MNKVITFICCCVLFMSCKEAHNNISKSESACDDTTSVKCWKSEAKEKYSRREEYYFAKGKDSVNFYLRVVHRKDGRIILNMNHSFWCRENARAALPFVEQIKLVDVYIKTHLGNDSVGKIAGIVTSSIFCGDLDVEITKEYYRTRERVPIDSILFKSRIREIIDSVFSPYHLHVNNVNTEKYLLADKTVLKEYNIPVSNYDSLPQKIIEGYPYFRLTVKNP